MTALESQPLSHEGKIAIVTGAARGIGAATAQRLCAEGMRVALADRDLAGAETLAAALRADGHQALAFAADVADEASVKALVDAVAAAWGSVHALVNNAGFTRDMRITRMAVADWDSVVDVILKGAFLCTRAVLPLMTRDEQRWGRIVNVSSRAHLGNPGQANYSAAKAGMHGFSMALAQEMATKGVTVNTVSPGYIGTDMVNAIRPDVLEKIVATVPVKRLGEPSEIASIIAWLASEEGGYATGADFSVNGGLHMG